MILPDGHLNVMEPVATAVQPRSCSESADPPPVALTSLERQVLDVIRDRQRDGDGLDVGEIADQFHLDLADAADLVNRLLDLGTVLREE